MAGRARFGSKTSTLMGETDDIVRDSKQAREDVLTTMLEAGLLPHTKHLSLEDENDIEGLYRTITKYENPIVVYRIPRNVTEDGWMGGACCAATIAGMPENAHGKVTLSFDGWANDPRELFEIPCVVDWCRGFLFVSEDKPWHENAQRVLSIMYDEHAVAFVDGVLVDESLLGITGGMWLISAAFATDVYFRDLRSPSGWSRDYDMAFSIREWLAGRAKPPTK